VTPKPKRPKWGEPGSHTTRRTSASVFSRGARRAVIVTVYPDGVLGLRLSRTRREELVAADTVYREAVIARVAIERAQRKARRKAKA
jgi:hypothetical protein